ncbi:MAG TPA: ATP phosphoribosyltransferase regulatory subunit [Epulopiscium sp.]|nr:ATP phosphoribosyltransferase regulatory subunit [Candidatus Epulonipiscium sp.]
MKNYKLHTVEGVKDFLPCEQKQKNEIEQRINSIFYRYGYEPIQTPTFEYVEVFAKEDGNVARGEMYKFLDRKGNVLALRPDLTPPIARVAATSFQDEVFPLRLSYVGSAYRHVEGYQGKLHEFTQAGVELLGNRSVYSDAEVIAVAANSLKVSGVEEFVMHLGQVSFFKSIMEETGLDLDVMEEIRVLIENKNIVALEEFTAHHNIKPEIAKLLQELPKLCGDITIINRAKTLTNNKKALQALEELELIYELLGEYNVEKNITFDLGMVSRLEYYTGIIFKAYTSGSGSEILGGGRYDTLIGKFGRDVPATGFGVNIHELLGAINNQAITLDTWQTDTLVMYTSLGRKIAMQTSEELRRTGLYIENSLIGDNVEDNIAYANQKNIGGILFFQDEENVELINIGSNERFTTKVSDMLKG